MKLPEGYEADETPRPVQGATAFGGHSSSCEVAGGYLTCRRSLTVKAAVIPADRYEETRTFFARANGEGEGPLVLAKRREGPLR